MAKSAKAKTTARMTVTAWNRWVDKLFAGELTPHKRHRGCSHPRGL